MHTSKLSASPQSEALTLRRLLIATIFSLLVALAMSCFRPPPPITDVNTTRGRHFVARPKEREGGEKRIQDIYRRWSIARAPHSVTRDTHSNPFCRRKMADVDPIEKIGGSSRFVTLITLVIHFVHPLLCIANYLDWVRHQNSVLGDKLVVAYLAMSIISALFYLLVSSVFYMWAFRYPEPEEIAKRRRIYGIITNLIFSDFPIFLVEVQIVWDVGFATGLQGTSFIFTCISLLYSGLRVWTFVMVKVIKVQAPMVSGLPAYAGARSFDGGPAMSYRGGSAAQFGGPHFGGPGDYEMRAGGVIPSGGGLQYSPSRGGGGGAFSPDRY